MTLGDPTRLWNAMRMKLAERFGDLIDLVDAQLQRECLLMTVHRMAVDVAIEEGLMNARVFGDRGHEGLRMIARRKSHECAKFATRHGDALELQFFVDEPSVVEARLYSVLKITSKDLLKKPDTPTTCSHLGWPTPLRPNAPYRCDRRPADKKTCIPTDKKSTCILRVRIQGKVRAN